MKRFYKTVTTALQGQGYAILLDGKAIKTPGKVTFLAPSRGLADLVMQEWANQKDSIIPDTMPFTQIISTRMDRIPGERAAMTKYVLKYLDTDLVCYHVDLPPELAKMQKDAWTPILQWFEKEYGVALHTTQFVAALNQDARAHEAVAKAVNAMDDEHFTILQMMTAISGSLVLALMFTKRQIDAKDFYDAMRVEERHKAGVYNEEKYGQEPIEEAKNKAIQRDIEAAQTYLELLD